jgi:5-methylcytosine-specific restriction endonuclease McrA
MVGPVGSGVRHTLHSRTVAWLATEAVGVDRAIRASSAWRVRQDQRRRKLWTANNLRVEGSAASAARVEAYARGDLTAAQWAEIQAAHDHRCAYCHGAYPLTLDHIVPIAKGGTHTASNILPACTPCNSQKGTRPVEDFRARLRDKSENI